MVTHARVTPMTRDPRLSYSRAARIAAASLRASCGTTARMARGPVTGAMVVPTATEASACRVAAATGTGPDARGTAVGKAAEGAATADDAAEGAATADDAAEGAATADDAAEGEAGEGVVAPGRECGPLAVH